MRPAATEATQEVKRARARRYRRRARSDRPGFKEQPRDLEILVLLYEHRFLRTSRILASLASRGYSEHVTRRRLRILFDHELIEKPLLQQGFRHGGGSDEDAYALNDGGADQLARKLGKPRLKGRWREKNRQLRERLYLDHTLLISTVVTAFDQACHARPGFRTIYPDEILLQTHPDVRRTRNPFSWRVEVDGHSSPLPVVPDKVFGIQDQSRPKGEDCLWFFLEADRGTMDIEPGHKRAPWQHTMLGKYAGYQAAYQRGEHTTRYGFGNIRVLTVTDRTPVRLKNMMAAARRATNDRNANLFLFADAENLLKHDALTFPWLNAQGEPRPLTRQ
jgi:Replication-relaxation